MNKIAVITQSIRQKTPYIIVVFLFVFAFVFGKNMVELTPEQLQLRELLYAQQRADSKLYTVSSSQKDLEIKNFFPIQKGQCGRLVFGLRNLPTKNSDGVSSYEKSQVRVSLTNDFAEKQDLGLSDLKGDMFVENKEINVCANTDFSNLILAKEGEDTSSSFETSNVAFIPLASGKTNLSDLQPSIYGNTDLADVVYDSEIKASEAVDTLSFTRRNQLIGQTFEANSTMISGVDIKLEFSGEGGTGNYYLELREADYKNGKVSLSPDRIAYFGFNKNSADRELKIDEGVYHIPLAAKVEKGKSYFVGINNLEVKFNILNTLKLYSGDSDVDHGKIITSINERSKQKSGQLYLKVYGAEYAEAGGEKVLTGARIIDNGDGTGTYSYDQKGEVTDYLDLYQVISDKNSSVFYDNIQGGISGKDEEGTAFVYKINTLHPFLKMRVEAKQPNGLFVKPLIYYSFDNINWTEIKNDLAVNDPISQADPARFDQSLQGNGILKTVYLKVAYDRDDAKEKKMHLFGLNSLKISASLLLY